jgi:exopolysaccharide biosynthesis polyprenyl glycosylphosphotransferase
VSLLPLDPLLPGSERTPQSLDTEIDEKTPEIDLRGSIPGPGDPAAAKVRPARSPGRKALPLLVAGDSVAIAVGIIVGQLAFNKGKLPGVLADVLYVPVVLLVFCGYGLYRRGRRRILASTFPDMSHIVHSLLVGSLPILLFTTVITRNAPWIPSINRRAVLVADLLALVLIPMGRIISRRLAGSKGRHSTVLIVGSGLIAARIAARMAAAPDIDVVGCVDDNLKGVPDLRADASLLGGLADLPRLVAEHNVDRLVVAFSPVTESEVAARLRSMADQVQICVVPRMFDLLTVRSHVDELAGLPVIDVAPPSLGPADRFAKRTLDIIVATAGLILLSPVFVAIAIAIKVSSPGPVLFGQQRIGRNGKPFRIYKFRTMAMDAERQREELAAANEVDGPIFKIQKDPRITRVGAILRPTSLDELPQFINVLSGKMSLVGPRPFVTAESNEIGGWAARRFDVRPGVTGLWQVSGRNDLPFDELQRLDYSYVASWSLWWDLRILWHTPASVARRNGAY